MGGCSGKGMGMGWHEGEVGEFGGCWRKVGVHL